MADTGDLHLLDDGEGARLLASAPWKRFVALGASDAAGITEAVDGFPTIGWFDHVSDVLRQVRPDTAALNLGKRDLVSSEVRASQLGPALEFAPDLAAVLSGGNDILRRDFDPDATRAEALPVIEALHEAGATIMTMGLFDITISPYVPEKYRKVMSERLALLGELTRELGRPFDAIHVDLPSHPAAARADIFSSDGLHLNARGQAVVGAAAVRALGRRLAG